MTGALVSVGVPVFQGENFLALCLESLVSQTYDDLEVIISDNGSTDATQEICREFAHRDERIRYDRLPDNLGAAANYNRLVRMARGRYFKWASHDDLCDPLFVERCVQELLAHPAAALAYPRTRLIDEGGDVLRDFNDRLDLRRGPAWWRVWRFTSNWNLCNAAFGVIDRRRLLDTGLIRPKVGSDVTLLGELAARGEFREVPEQLFYRRIHRQSSRQGDLTIDEIAEWFDPRNPRVSRVSPGTRVVGEFIVAMMTSRLPALTRVSCAAAYPTAWGLRRMRVRVGHLRRSVLDLRLDARR